MIISAVALAVICGCSAKPAPERPAAIERKEEPPRCVYSERTREERRIPSLTEGIELFVMSVAAFGERRGAVVFTHGAGSPSSASWDLEHGEYSLMRHLACQGFDTYALDLRGFGGSTMPQEMSRPAEESTPLVRAADAMPDVEAAVRFAMERSKVERVDLFGWSWGSDVSGMYASTRPDRIRRLVLVAPVYDRRWPARHRTAEGWRIENREDFFRWFDESTEERAVLDTFVSGMFRFTKSDELRLPNGPYRDIYGKDAPVWDPRRITAATLVVRGEHDRASLEPHAYALFAHLSAAKMKRYLVIGGADHFLFRKKKVYRSLHRAVSSFLLEPS